MKMRIATNLLVMIVAAAMIGGSLANFHDSEVCADNTFTAGTLDLEVNGESGGCVPWTSADNMKPGNTYFSGFKTLCNAGSIDGELNVTIQNLVCSENGVLPPEAAAGDSVGSQLDPDGFSQEGGNGELWDQVMFTIVIDDGDGVRNWKDQTMYLYPDESGYYSIPVGSPIQLDSDFQSGECMDFGVEVKFIDDQASSYDWILDGVPNNAAMGDSISMDLNFQLTQ